MFAIGGAGGAGLFAVAQTGLEVKLAMALIGIGCAPVLMAGYYIVARRYSAAVFGTLAGVMLGVGSLGNIASSLPLAFAMEAVGWRGTLWILAGVSLLAAAGVAVLVRDPVRVEHGVRGSLLDILRIKALWFIFPLTAVNYLPAAGLRGLWAGPYLSDIYGMDAAGIGKVTLVMGLAMILGNLSYGPLERVLRTRKWLIFGGNLFVLAGLVGLWAMPAQGPVFAAVLLAGIGFCGASFPMIVAHGRAFFPAHLVGRGVTLLNLFSIGGTGLAQVFTGYLNATAASPQAGYVAIFGFFALVMAIGLVIYAFAQDRVD